MVHRSVLSPMLAVALLLLGAITAGCSQPGPAPAVAGRAGTTHVLMINGGGRREQNYQSHLLHVRELRRLLLATGVPAERMTIASSDGMDPGEDLAVREPQSGDDLWLIEGTRLDGRLRAPVVYANSVIDGATMLPATKQALDGWFRQARRTLKPGDTLLLYVTDHGTKNAEDPRNNRIVLWGKDETLTVSELRAMLGRLDRGVRVVMLMSQCYSGAFAHLATPPGAKSLPAGNVCGYFASTADRPAYGCYPENRGRANVGHSFHVIDQLQRTGDLAAAHREILVTDATPDVPLRTSDQFFDDVLHRVAGTRDFTAVVDEWLAAAWTNRAAWEAELRLLDRIGQAYGYFSPRSLAELEAQTKELPELSESLKQQSRAWKEALGSVNSALLEHVTATEPSWAARLDDKALATIDPAAAQAITAEFLPVLRAAIGKDAKRGKRQKTLRHRSDLAAALSYRMEVRLGVVLRMRALLVSIAGQTYLAARGTPAERAAWERLRTCEHLVMPTPALPAEPLERSAPFPSFEDDLRLAETALPAWMGIQFKPTTKEDREARSLPSGAATVMAVYPESPAMAAGIEAGDAILGPPGAPFSEPHQVREWIMLSSVDVPRDLMIAHGDAQRRVTLVPKPYPRKWPKLPGPPRVGSAAPELHLTPYRGEIPTALAGGKPHMLFFWATWCGICKAAVPELLALEQDRGIRVIAITDETAKQLDPFFQQWTAPFPAVVATDAYRRDFLAYGVSGTPTFVLVDDKGTVTDYITGYKAATGLDIKGWRWSGRTPAAAAPANAPAR